jgi:hypothetical protein
MKKENEMYIKTVLTCTDFLKLRWEIDCSFSETKNYFLHAYITEVMLYKHNQTIWKIHSKIINLYSARSAQIDSKICRVPKSVISVHGMWVCDTTVLWW